MAAALDPVVQGDDVQDVQQLALVVVHALHLAVQHSLRVEDQTLLGMKVPGQTVLVELLDLSPALLELRIVCQGHKLAELGQVGHPLVANGVIDQVSQRRVGLLEPPPRRDAVGLVVEPAGVELVEIVQNVVLDDAAVQL